MKVLVLFSGGMDSATLVAECVKHLGRENVETISFDYGSKHNDMEWFYAKKFCNYYGVKNTRVDLKEIGKYLVSDLLKSGGDIPEGHYADPSMKRTVVPFRNGIMLSVAVGIAESRGIEMIALANHFGDHAIYPDCREAFVAPFAQAVEAGTYLGVKLEHPFTGKTKTEIAKKGSELGVPYGLTYSCYNGRTLHCGKCGTCVERKEAFADSGIYDPTVYEPTLK